MAVAAHEPTPSLVSGTGHVQAVTLVHQGSQRINGR
jgi:hypothetical protein